MADGSLSPCDPNVCAACGHQPLEAMRDAHARMLRRMAEICLDVAEAVRGEVMDARAEPAPDKPEAPASETPAPVAAVAARLVGHDVGLTLSRLGRTLRLSLALERRFADEERSFAEQARDREEADEEAAAARAADWQAELDEARLIKGQAIQIAKAMAVEQLKDKGVAESDIDPESLFADLNEKLADDSDLEALVGYTLVDLVGLLCQGLDVPFEPRAFKGDQGLRNEWLDELPPEPPPHPGWASPSGTDPPG